MSSEDRGLYEKYTVLTQDGEFVGGCFVLRPESDEAACEAICAYAKATDNDALREDLFDWLADIGWEHTAWERGDPPSGVAFGGEVPEGYFPVISQATVKVARGPVEEQETVKTEEGVVIADPGCYVIREEDGNEYPIQPEKFEDYYRRLDHE